MVIGEALAVASGGALGCLFRYGMEFIPGLSAKPLPVITSNIVGCLLIGVLSAIFERYEVSAVVSRFFITGLLGGFTTFSAFSLHPVTLMRGGEWLEAVGYVSISVIGGLAACALAMFATERIIN